VNKIILVPLIWLMVLGGIRSLPAAAAEPIHLLSPRQNQTAIQRVLPDWVEQRLADTRIRIAAKMALWNDAFLNNTDVNVDVRNRYIILRGAVGTQTQSQRAGTLIAHVGGVRGVKNNLIVTGYPGPVDDRWTHRVERALRDGAMTTRIRFRILLAGLAEGTSVQVESINHVVIVQGIVATPQQESDIQALTRNTPGVEKIINRMIVR
jgi:osmotically-inducible protein OsmY